jgi:hypothetical protein
LSAAKIEVPSAAYVVTTRRGFESVEGMVMVLEAIFKCAEVLLVWWNNFKEVESLNYWRLSF